MFTAATRVLIVDDDLAFANAAAQLARAEECETEIATSVAEGHAALCRSHAHLLMLDLDLPDGSGLELLRRVDSARAPGRVVVLTGNPTLESAVRAVAEPVTEYLLKPLCPERWRAMLQAARSAGTASDCQLLRTVLLGRSPAMRRLVATLLQAAPTAATVLLVGESGTGKALTARALHQASGRDAPFVAIACAALGSTDAPRASPGGALEQARGGTLFLDELAAMPCAQQATLARALEGGTVRARIVASMSCDPHAAIREGRLREDLYYLLSEVPVRVPPLRERGDDVLLLAHAFIDRLNARSGRRKRLAPSCERELSRHPWPGNVRELMAAVNGAYVLDDGDAVRVLPAGARIGLLGETDTSMVFSVGTRLAEVQRRMLAKTLAHFGGDKSATARALGISVRTVHNQLARQARERPWEG